MTKGPDILPHTSEALVETIRKGLLVPVIDGESPEHWIEGRAHNIAAAILGNFGGECRRHRHDGALGVVPIRQLDDITEEMPVPARVTTFDVPPHPLGCACAIC